MPTREFIDNPADIKLNTHDEVDQILGRPPGWMLRWGIVVVACVFIIFISISYFLKYPDEVQASVSITTENPSIKVVARASGKIDKLFIANNQSVKEGEIIALLDDPASLEDINKISAFLDQLNTIPEQAELSTKLPNDLKLGEIQNTYAAFSQKIQDYAYFLNRNDTAQKIQSLRAQIKHTTKLNTNLSNQKTTLLQEKNLVEKNFLRNKDLHQKGVVSEIDLEKSETQFLQQKRQLEILENSIVNNDISIEEIRSTIIDLSQSRADGQSERLLRINEDIDRLKSEIALWKQQYVISAPISGNVSFSNIWSEQQFINANDVVLTMVPSEGSGKVIARAFLPLHNSGKVQIGQTTNIRLDGFPYQEYGIIKGTVKNISLVPVASSAQVEESYLLDIQLPDTLFTTYNKIIPFRQKMTGTASIITEDRRIIERIFDRIFSLLKNT